MCIRDRSYVGEIGFELYVRIEDSKKLFLTIVNEGKNHNLSLCGAHAMDIMRMESGFLHWGHDISPEENQYQAGLQFAISYKKNINFIGKEALLKIKDQKQKKLLAMMVLKDNKPGQPLLLHEEPIYLDDKIIGRTTSGNYSFNFEKNISIVSSDQTKDGYTKNDTVVIFDRVRENLKKYSDIKIFELSNISINETLSRTIITSATTLLALLSIYIFGGEILKGFSFAMILGVIFGTYSSIYIANPLLVKLNVSQKTIIKEED